MQQVIAQNGSLGQVQPDKHKHAKLDDLLNSTSGQGGLHKKQKIFRYIFFLKTVKNSAQFSCSILRNNHDMPPVRKYSSAERPRCILTSAVPTDHQAENVFSWRMSTFVGRHALMGNQKKIPSPLCSPATVSTSNLLIMRAAIIVAISRQGRHSSGAQAKNKTLRKRPPV